MHLIRCQANINTCIGFGTSKYKPQTTPPVCLHLTVGARLAREGGVTGTNCID